MRNPFADNRPSLLVSAKTALHMDELRLALDVAAFGGKGPEASLALTARHLRAIQEALEALDRAAHVASLPELLALELRTALDALGQILGIVSTDDLLAQIFSRFCIGK